MTWNAEDVFRIYDPMHTSLWHLVRKRRTQVYMTVQTSWTNDATMQVSLNVGQYRPYSTEESARSMSDPTRVVKCVLKRLCKHYSEASVHSWSFPHQEMHCEVKVVTEAYWKGELEGLSTTGVWISLVVIC